MQYGRGRVRTSVFVGDDFGFAVLEESAPARGPGTAIATYTGGKGYGTVGVAKGDSYRNPRRGVGLRTHAGQGRLWTKHRKRLWREFDWATASRMTKSRARGSTWWCGHSEFVQN